MTSAPRQTPPPIALVAQDVTPGLGSNYPAEFAARVAGREKRALGDVFGLTRFGVNLTTLPPGAQSALLHVHSHSQEFIYILEGHPTLRTDQGDVALAPGMCAGFAPKGLAHHLINTSTQPVTYLEIGDRVNGDQGHYPEDDLKAEKTDQGWQFQHRDGRPY